MESETVVATTETEVAAAASESETLAESVAAKSETVAESEAMKPEVAAATSEPEPVKTPFRDMPLAALQREVAYARISTEAISLLVGTWDKKRSSRHLLNLTKQARGQLDAYEMEIVSLSRPRKPVPMDKLKRRELKTERVSARQKLAAKIEHMVEQVQALIKIVKYFQHMPATVDVDKTMMSMIGVSGSSSSSTV